MQRFTSDAQLDNWFGFHKPPNQEVIDAHEEIRAASRRLAATFQELIPEGPDKTVALRAVREAMWAGNAAIACNQQGGEA